MQFTIQTRDTAAAELKPVFDRVQKAYGFIPNLYGIFANSPLALHTYLGVLDLIDKHSALTPQEQQLAMLAISAENGCDYCVAAHSAVAAMVKAPAEDIQAIRDNTLPPTPKHAALVRFARSTVAARGFTPAEDIEAFFAAGYAQRHVLDVLTIAALKTLSNYTNHLAHTPVDAAFGGQR
ncbi:MAG: carboxymuconolactone decarboxylase family protein [Opitutae bacterium]|nr:carboxymuconolactone decarboxylase family protein [Opitutae bacterium]